MSTHPTVPAPLFRATQIGKSFNSVRVLEDISLDIGYGEVVALLGENGAGKSTFSSIIAGALAPSKGSMFLAGEPYAPNGPAAAMVTGLELTQKSLLSAFESNGLTRVDPAPGEAFDPHLHQAMMEQPSDTVPGGAVIQTLQPGYALFGRTVRAAMVVVAAKGSGPAGGAYSEANTTGGNFDAKA